MLPNTEMEDTGGGIALVVVVVIMLRNQEFGFGKVKYPSKKFRRDDMINCDKCCWTTLNLRAKKWPLDLVR